MAQWIKVSDAKPNHMGLIPGTKMMDKEKQLL